MKGQRVFTSDFGVSNSEPITEGHIARLMGSYEETHAVEDYWAFGWRVWPALRTRLAPELYMHGNFTDVVSEQVSLEAENRGVTRLTRSLVFYLEPIRDYIQWTRDVRRGATPPPSRSCDVLIFGSGRRYQLIGGKWVHYPTAPLADLLENAGLRCHIWQWGEQPSPVDRPAANVEPVLRVGLRLANALTRFRCVTRMPDWYPEFDGFFRRYLNRHLSWETLAGDLYYMAPRNNILERWIRRARPGLVVLDCWYNALMIATALAAHRLGIPVLDLQHGIQEQTHSSYHWWRKEPAGGWEAIPDIYWVWGQRAENLFHETNRIQREVLHGGSPWMCRWLSKKEPELDTVCAEVSKLTQSYLRSILVTLPFRADPGMPYLKDVISKSPKDWIWLIRTHPLDNVYRQGIEQELGQFGQTRVRLHAATELPLYALLRTVDLHVTNNSTCSNEALVFGKPTILISKPGLAHFRQFVETGVMFYAERPEDFFETVERALEVDPLCLKQAARSLFTVDEGETSHALNRIVEIVRSVKQGQTYAATR